MSLLQHPLLFVMNCFMLFYMLSPSEEAARDETHEWNNNNNNNKTTGGPAAFPALFVFGDSIVDTGNNNFRPSPAKCNFPPYGKDFFQHRPTGRFSNGKVPSDFGVSRLGIKELLPAYATYDLSNEDLLTGVCFASGGAGYDDLTSQAAVAISMGDQVKMFENYKEKLQTITDHERAEMIVSKSLYIIVTGSNDIVNTFFGSGLRQAQYDLTSYISFLTSSAATLVEDLYKLGARKIAVAGLPPLGCLPSQRTLFGGLQRDCVDKYNEASERFNNALSLELDELQQKLSTRTIVYADLFKKLLRIIQYPSEYGFVVSTKGCCGTGMLEVTCLCNQHTFTCDDDSKYVFWDSFHPTQRVYEILIDELIQEDLSRLL